MCIFFKKISFILLFGIFISSLFLSSCKKEEEQTQPQLPPEGAFVMDFNDFKNDKKIFEDSKTTANWGWSAIHVAVWNTIITAGLVVPVTTYVEALKQTPQHHSGTTWLWEYSVPVGFKTYTSQLYGTIADSQVEWEMQISEEEGFQDFIWYTGTHNVEGTQGQWILYKSPTENYKYLQIDWTFNKEDSTGTLKYTNIVQDGPENGGYIYYGNDQEGDLDAFYDIFNKGKSQLVEIEWNSILLRSRSKIISHSNLDKLYNSI